MERFVKKVIKTKNGCWLWSGSIRNKSGYGGFNLNGKTMYAHRAAYILYKEEIPEGLLICHKCDNRLCVNPEHLFLGTAKDNWQDAVNKGRIELKTIENPVIKRGPHPSNGYYFRGCRCDGCKKAHAINNRKYPRKK
jgi:hypothetical protein